MPYVSIGSIGIFGPFELDFEPLHTDLKPVHGLNGRLCTCRIVETDETFTNLMLLFGYFSTETDETRLTETFALIGGTIDENFGTDDVTKRQKHLHQFRITKLLR